MLEFHYDVINKEFPNSYNLIYSDTDSFVYNIRTPDIYKWIKEHASYFDLSDSKRPELKDDTNKKVLGKFKDEMNSLVITAFIANNPKSYSIMYSTNLDNTEIKNKKALKGVSSVVVEKEITHKDYVDVLQTNIPLEKTVTSIRSFNHQLFTYQTQKKAITSFYDKMVMVNAIDCQPYGYNPL
jgi:hypothetical protein